MLNIIALLFLALFSTGAHAQGSSKSPNLFWATPCSGSGFLALRAPCAADLTSVFGADTIYAQPVLNSSGAFFFSPVFDVTAFGEVGDGTTVNNTANANALTAVAAVGGQVRYPCGTFKITNAQAVTIPNNANLTIKGGGQDCTKILFSGASATGFTFTYGNQFSSVNVQDLTILTDQAGATSGTAIHLLSTVANANPALSASNIIQNVTIIGADRNSTNLDYWLKSIWQDNVSNVTITGTTLTGASTLAGKMLTMNGNPGSTTYAVTTTLAGDIFMDCGQCIQIGSYYQGLSITGGNFTGGVNAIKVPVSLTGSLDELAISAAQFGYFTANIIDILTTYDNVLLANNEFDLNVASTTAINLTGGTFYSITGNSFFSPVGTGTVGINLIFAAASGNDTGTISSNSFYNLGTGISPDNSTSASITGNKFSAVVSPILPSSASTAMSSIIDNNPGSGFFYSFANLPTCATATQGTSLNALGAAALAWGATLTTGSVPYRVWCDAANWTVMAK